MLDCLSAMLPLMYFIYIFSVILQSLVLTKKQIIMTSESDGSPASVSSTW